MEQNNTTKKAMTLEDIAGLIQKLDTKIGSVKTDLEAKIDSSTTEIATMTQKQFLEYDEKIGKRFDKVDERFDTIEAELIKKVNVIDNNTLKYRVEKLEKKFA